MKKQTQIKNQPEEKGSLDSKISDDDSDSDFSPTKISRVTQNSTIERNNDLASLVQSSDEPDNPTVQHNILPTVKSKIIYHNPDSKSWNEALVLGKAGKSNGKK